MNLKEYLGKPWYKEPFYIGTAILFVLIGTLLAYDIYVDSNSVEISYESEFVGEINQVHSQKSTYYLRLQNEDKWIRIEQFRNNSEPKLNISGWFPSGVFHKGDTVYKNRNSNELHLVRNH